MHPFIQDLMSLFQGFGKAYGVYGKKLTEQEGGKLKGKAASVKGEVTVDLWMRHCSGEQGLGIIPINEASEVKFAAIDIDQYPLDLMQLNAQIQQHELPLTLCRTKSGGAHLYAFLTEFHDAGVIQRRMREFAALLGYGNSEIFPKQTKIIVERGDVGQWINMPYFDAPATQRYALDHEGHQLSVLEFIQHAKKRVISPTDFLSLKIGIRELLPGGPPCLNHLITMGFPPGTRNNGLFNMGVYARKAHPDNWQAMVEEYNQKYMDPPLDTTEVLGVIKSLNKKEFMYLCKQPPISQYCNAPKCRACKHGVGHGDIGMPKFGSLTKVKTQPPVWFIEVEGGGRIELTTEQLQSQRLFQNRCMEALNMMPIMPKNDVWQEVVHRLLLEVNEVDVPDEVTPSGQLRQHLEDFCTSRVQAKTAEEILMGKPYTLDGWHYFRMRDFLAYLDRIKFREFKSNYIAMHLKEWGADQKFWNLRGKGTNTIKIREFTNKQTESFQAAIKPDDETPY